MIVSKADIERLILKKREYEEASIKCWHNRRRYVTETSIYLPSIDWLRAVSDATGELMRTFKSDEHGETSRCVVFDGCTFIAPVFSDVWEVDDGVPA